MGDEGMEGGLDHEDSDQNVNDGDVMSMGWVAVRNYMRKVVESFANIGRTVSASWDRGRFACKGQGL